MRWKKVNLGSLIENFSVRAKDYGGSEGLEFLGVSNDNGIVTSKYAAEEKGEDYKIIEKGCFAYNPYRINVGSIAYCDSDIKALISPAYVVFKTKPNTIKEDLLLKFLKSSEGLRQIKFYGRGTVRQALRFDDLCKIELSIPSFENQESLISNIQKIEIKTSRLHTELSYQLNLVKNLRQQLLQDAVQGKLVEQNLNDEPASVLLKKIKNEKELLIRDKKLKKEKELLIRDKKLKKEKELSQIKPEDLPFAIPENWIWCRLGEISKEITYGTSEKASDIGDVPVLRMGNITSDGRIIYSNLKYVSYTIKDLPKLYLKDGDMLFNRTNSYELVGKTGVFKNLEKYTLASYLIRVRFMNEINSNYISNYTNSSICRKTQLEPQIIQQNGQANFNGTKLSNILIPLPPLSEQYRIVQKLNKLMQTCDALEASIKQSQCQNEQLLQQVLREALTKEVEQNKQLIEPAYIESVDDNKYKVLLLAAEIIWQLNQTQTLGHIKLQKLIYLCNRTQKMNLPVNFLKWAMGPYDPELQKYIDNTLVENEWFKYDESAPLKYQPLKNAGGHRTDFELHFGDEKIAIYYLIQHFENARSARIEIVATLFACWEEMILNDQLINDTALLSTFYNWSDKKKKYTTEKVIDALRWMENQNITPEYVFRSN